MEAAKEPLIGVFTLIAACMAAEFFGVIKLHFAEAIKRRRHHRRNVYNFILIEEEKPPVAA